MILKIGTAPFHFWFPSVSEGIPWINNFILITWQKLAPIIISSYCINLNLLVIISLLCLMFGRLGGLNQTSLRKLIAFSSISHIGWILVRMIFNETIWLIYFRIYVILVFNIIYFFNYFKIYYLNQLFFFFNFNNFLKILFFLLFYRLGGLPPFLGFYPKWIIIQILIFNKFYFLLLIFLFFTLLTLFFYIRVTYSIVLINSKNKKLIFKSLILKTNFILFFWTSFLRNFRFLLINLLFF